MKSPKPRGIALHWSCLGVWLIFEQVFIALYFSFYWVEIGNRAEFNLNPPSCLQNVLHTHFHFKPEMKSRTLKGWKHLLRGSWEAPRCCSCPVPAPRKSDSGPVCISSLAVCFLQAARGKFHHLCIDTSSEQIKENLQDQFIQNQAKLNLGSVLHWLLISN